MRMSIWRRHPDANNNMKCDIQLLLFCERAHRLIRQVFICHSFPILRNTKMQNIPLAARRICVGNGAESSCAAQQLERREIAWQWNRKSSSKMNSSPDSGWRGTHPHFAVTSYSAEYTKRAITRVCTRTTMHDNYVLPSANFSLVYWTWLPKHARRHRERWEPKRRSKEERKEINVDSFRAEENEMETFLYRRGKHYYTRRIAARTVALWPTATVDVVVGKILSRRSFCCALCVVCCLPFFPHFGAAPAATGTTASTSLYKIF